MVSSKITLFWHSRGHSIGHIVYGIMCSHVYTTGAGVVNLNCSETGGSGAFPKGLQDVHTESYKLRSPIPLELAQKHETAADN